MTLKELIELNGYNLASFSKKYDIPYSTLNDIVNDKTKLCTCKGTTLYKLAKALDMSVESLIENTEYTKNIKTEYEEVAIDCTIFSLNRQHLTNTHGQARGVV